MERESQRRRDPSNSVISRGFWAASSILAALVISTGSLAVPVQYTLSARLASNTGSDLLQLEGAFLRYELFADTLDPPVRVFGAETISARYVPQLAITSIVARPNGAPDLAFVGPASILIDNSPGALVGDILSTGAHQVAFPGSPIDVRMPGFAWALAVDTPIGIAPPLPLFEASDVLAILSDDLKPADSSNSFAYRTLDPAASATIVPEPGSAALVIAGFVLISLRARSTTIGFRKLRANF